MWARPGAGRFGAASAPQGGSEAKAVSAGLEDDAEGFGQDVGSAREPEQGLAREWCSTSVSQAEHKAAVRTVPREPRGRIWGVACRPLRQTRGHRSKAWPGTMDVGWSGEHKQHKQFFLTTAQVGTRPRRVAPPSRGAERE